MWDAQSYVYTQWLFTELLLLVYLLAFASLTPQVLGLYGSHGLLPIADVFRRKHGPSSWRRWLAMPSIFWIDSSDRSIRGLVWGACVVSVLGLVGVVPHLLALVLLYVGLLSICSVGREFMSFQWDVLLLESSVYAVLFNLSSPPSLLSLLLLWLLLFRLMFSSGRVKIRSGCPAWASWTAMDYHYWTQPIPNPIAWFMQRLPHSFHKFSVGLTFFLELIVPFFIWTPLPVRYVAFVLLVTLQLMILCTGNFAYFNILTIVLCIPLIPLGGAVLETWSVWTLFVDILCVPFILLNLSILLPALGRLSVMQRFRQLVAPFYVGAGYGLFAVMTTERLEIIIEGSNDEEHWQAYEFPYKPGDPHRMPPVVAPHQPRLDWQLWFAALRPYAASPWMTRLFRHLLTGSPDVLKLVQHNPFPGSPPRYVRAELYRYRFTGFGEKAWWNRERVGSYAPSIKLPD